MSAIADIKVKTMLAGDAGVGKTEFSVVNDGTMVPPAGSAKRRLPEARATIGADFVVANRIHRRPEGGQVSIRHEIWDTAGQERFQAIVQGFFRNADVIVFVYDVTNASSFDSLENLWYPMVSAVCPRHCQYYIVGSKADKLTDNGGERTRAVDVDKIASFASSIEAEAFETDVVLEGGKHAYDTFTTISEFVSQRAPPPQTKTISKIVIKASSATQSNGQLKRQKPKCQML